MRGKGWAERLGDVSRDISGMKARIERCYGMVDVYSADGRDIAVRLCGAGSDAERRSVVGRMMDGVFGRKNGRVFMSFTSLRGERVLVGPDGAEIGKPKVYPYMDILVRWSSWNGGRTFASFMPGVVFSDGRVVFNGGKGASLFQDGRMYRTGLGGSIAEHKGGDGEAFRFAMLVDAVGRERRGPGLDALVDDAVDDILKMEP